jgi:hypothetical protein
VYSSDDVELFLKTSYLRIALRDSIIARVDHVCRLLQPLLEILNLSVMERDWKPYEAYRIALRCAALAMQSQSHF